MALLPSLCLAQTQAEYEHVMAGFVKFYNHELGDSIRYMWPESERNDEWMMNTWGNKSLQDMHKKYGEILSYEYLGIDKEDPNPGLAVFKTNFSVVGWKTTSFTFEKGYLATFRFITSSSEIDKMLKGKK